MTCNVPQTITPDKPFDATTVISSFADGQCAFEVLATDTVFYRYYSYPEAPILNIGRFFSTDFLTLNSDAIVQLALYPFPPNPQFQNFAYYREQVLISAGIGLYLGLTGPQPVTDLTSCYRGGASQYFFAGVDISVNPGITFSSAEPLTKDTRYQNEYGVGDPCNANFIPITGTVMLLGIGGLILLTMIGIRRQIGPADVGPGT